MTGVAAGPMHMVVEFSGIEKLTYSGFGTKSSMTLVGGALADKFELGSGNNTVHAGGGDDFIASQAGSDFVWGDDGNDVLSTRVSGSFDGGAGVDVLSIQYYPHDAIEIDLSDGGGGRSFGPGMTVANVERLIFSGSMRNDTLIGGASGNILSGGEGDDYVEGGAAADSLEGGFNGVTGDTIGFVNSAAGVNVNLLTNEVSGGDASGDQIRGFENVRGSAFDDALIGTDTANRLEGGAGDDELYGLKGDDTLEGGAGADVMNGGTGVNTLNYSTSNGGVMIDLASHAASGADAEGDSFSNIRNIVGSETDDGLSGDDAANTLKGNGGADVLIGRGGADLLAGGTGFDTLDGGSGDDTLFSIDSDTIQGGTGLDTVWLDRTAASEGFTLTLNSGPTSDGTILAGIEVLKFTGSNFADDVTGSAGNDTLLGMLGNDRLDGGTGSNVLDGGAGNDTFIASGNDVIIGGTGTDRVIIDRSSAPAGVTFNLATGVGSGGVTFSGIEAMTFTGTAFNDIAVGGTGKDFLYGGTGSDVLTGGLGADVLDGGLDGTLGRDRFVFKSEQDSGLGAEADVIMSFQHGIDIIDLDQVNAERGSTGAEFTFIGQKAFTGIAGQLRFYFDGGQTIIEGDTDGDASANLQIILDRVVGNLGLVDFLL